MILVRKHQKCKKSYVLSYKFLSSSYYGRFEEIIKNIKYNKKKVVIDIGCGRGELCFFLWHRFKKVIGIDTSKKDIGFARSQTKSKNIEFYVTSAERIPLNDNSVDVVVCSEVLQYVKDFKLALNEIKRILKPNGIILLVVPNKNFPFFRAPFLGRKSRKNLQLWGDMRRFFDDDMILKEFSDKYKVIRKSYIGHEIVSLLYPNYLISVINKYIMPKELVSGYLLKGKESKIIVKPRKYHFRFILFPLFFLSKSITICDNLLMRKSKKSISIFIKIKKLR